MSSDNLGRIALSGILGVVGAIAITKSELGGQTGLSEGIILWLIYAIACGLIINTQEGKPFIVIALAAITSSSTMVSTIVFKGLMGAGLRLSGAIIDFDTNLIVAAKILIVLFVFTTIAIVVSGYSRSVVLSLLDSLFAIELTKAKKIEAILNRVVSIGTIFTIIIFSIL